MATELPEKNESLWSIATSPAIWAAHFMICYGAAAVWCAKVAGPDGSLRTIRIAIAALTVLALAAIARVGWRGFKRHRIGGPSAPHDDDTPGDRHRFLGFTALLLSGLSAVAVLYSALPAVFIRSCR